MLRALEALPHIGAPAELEGTVRRQLAGGKRALERTVEAAAHDRGDLDRNSTEALREPSLIERALRDLPQIQVPELLDDLVLEPDPFETSQTAYWLRSLSRVPAPAVLVRLVGEELESPARHRIERFVGDLERLTVPAALDEQPLRLRSRSSRLRSLIAPLGALAAGLLLWASFASKAERAEEVDYGFDVVRVSTPDQLSPLAQSFLRGMTSGSRLRPDSSEKGSAQ